MPRNQRYDESHTEGDNWKSLSKKALYSSAIGSVGAYLIFDEVGESPFLNFKVPAAVAVGLSTAVGSVTSDLTSNFVLSKLDQSDDIKNAESTAIKLAISGVGTLGALKYASGIPYSIEAFTLGAAAKFGGDAVFMEMDVLGMLF